MRSVVIALFLTCCQPNKSLSTLLGCSYCLYQWLPGVSVDHSDQGILPWLSSIRKPLSFI